ncbi:MAG: hypothetical protein C4517_10160 [Stygiobacter sp.]|nr:MAG: hypothetical protein C4517_10160 [Stygiobacter sp.]
MILDAGCWMLEKVKRQIRPPKKLGVGTKTAGRRETGKEVRRKRKAVSNKRQDKDKREEGFYDTANSH